MKEKNFKICKDGREVSNITRAGEVTIFDAALGVAYSETEANFNAYLNELKKHGFTIIKNF